MSPIRTKREISHYYLDQTLPLQVAMDWLQQRNAGLAITERMLPAVLPFKAAAVALERTPERNGFYCDGQFHPSAAVHAGVAISLRSSELSAPTITLTTLDDQANESVFGVIYPLQVARVGFVGIVTRPWMREGVVCAVIFLVRTSIGPRAGLLQGANSHRSWNPSARGRASYRVQTAIDPGRASYRELHLVGATPSPRWPPKPSTLDGPSTGNCLMTTGRETHAATVLRLLRAIATELEPGTPDPVRSLRGQVDLDSMVWLNFLVSLHECFGVTFSAMAPVQV